MFTVDTVKGCYILVAGDRMCGWYGMGQKYRSFFPGNEGRHLRCCRFSCLGKQIEAAGIMLAQPNFLTNVFISVVE